MSSSRRCSTITRSYTRFTHTLAALPAELIQLICTALNRRDLKSLRLVCRAVASSAERILFRNVFLRRNMRSMGRLSNIATDARLGPQVHAVHVQGDLVWNRERCPQGFKRLGFQGAAPVFQEFFLADWEEHCRKYQQHLSRQKFFQSNNVEETMLLGAFDGLPNLQQLTFYTYQTHWDDRCSKPILPWHLRHINFRILPQFVIDGIAVHAAQFARLVSAAVKSHKRIRELSGYRLPAEALSRSAGAPNALSNICSNVMSLILEIPVREEREERDDDDDDGDHTWRVKKIIANAPRLHTLELSFSYPDRPHWAFRNRDLVRLPVLFDRAFQWPHLRRLKFGGLLGTQESLLHLLKTHAPTLRSLELGNIMLMDSGQDYDGDWLNNCLHHSEERWTKESAAHDCWASIIRFLAQELHLNGVRFYGTLMCE